MEISEVTINIDLEHIDLSYDFSAFMANMYIESDEFEYPHSQYIALPAMILRWFLRELRLIVGKNNKIKERSIYFYPDVNNYIVIEYMGEGMLCLKLVKRKLEKNFNIINTIISKEAVNEKNVIYCLFNDLFLEIYKKAEELLNKLERFEEQGGDLLVLKEELKYSEKIINKIQKGKKQ
ncbi:hypothetical protein LY28_03430 [Ruminiclostridium sufflavum DSM 19573]|uniref:Uncharacterized protein n=1 Tax=Ruminiclostridium sufflavum DSM 19573 TaxID=1121337 RepID=A0A318XGA5_9FIRM|nr:hypothetical protein [Ruminiclostridium sufflavum]PYG84972.1 hypothetical protein LY28_03430 [Ruminiclostridium sufflavum DSM 19573]